MPIFDQRSAPFAGTARVADVYSAREIARAAGVAVRLVREHVAAGAIPSLDGRFVAEREAVAAVRALQGATAGVAAAGTPGLRAPRELLSMPAPPRRRTGLPLALSSSLHVAAVLVFVAISSLGLLSDTEADLRTPIAPVRMVFLVQPGPGGGGGGGGLRQPNPPTRLKIARPKPRPVSRPIPIRRPPPVTTRAKSDRRRRHSAPFAP